MTGVSGQGSGTLTDDEAGVYYTCIVDSSTLGSANTPGGARGTVVVVSGVVIGLNVDCTRGVIVVVDGAVSSDNAGCDCKTSVGLVVQ